MGTAKFPVVNLRRYTDGTWNLNHFTGGTIESITSPSTANEGSKYIIYLEEVPAPSGLGGAAAPIVILNSVTLTHVTSTTPAAGECYINYATGGVIVNSATAGQTGTCDYYGKGSLIEAEDINETQYAQTVTVAKNGGDFTSLKSAIASITDASVSKPYQIIVYSGIYSEDNPITMKAYVDIVSSGESFGSVIQAQNTASNIIEIVGNCGITNLALTGATTAAAVRQNVAGLTKMEGLYITNCQTGLLVSHASADCYSNYFAVNTPISNFTDIIKVTAGKATVDMLRIFSGVTATNALKCENSGSKILAMSPVVQGSGVTTAVYADSSGEIEVFNADVHSCTNAFRIGSTGSSEIQSYNCHISAATSYDILIESATGAFYGFNTDIDRDKMSITSGATFKSTGYDRFANKYLNMISTRVGRDGDGSSLAVGEGGTYTANVKVLSYNGSTYVDETLLNPIDFPNTSANTALYFGNTASNKFYGFSFIMGAVQLAVGAGSVIWEYYDGGTSSWVEFDIMSNLNTYSDSYQNDPFGQASNGEILSIRFDQNINTGVTEHNSSATGWTTTTVNSITGYWIRYRIVTAITTSMEFYSVRLKNNYASVRDNGTSGRHGESRSLQTVQLFTGAYAGSTDNTEYNVSSNINMRGRENSFANGNADANYFQFIIPEDMDTSCGLKLSIDWKTSVSPGAGDQTAKMHIYGSVLPMSKVATQTILYNGTGTETHFAEDFVATNGDAANTAHRFETDRLDISAYSSGDVIYFSISRLANEAGDDLAGSVVITGLWCEYRSWQNGANYA